MDKDWKNKVKFLYFVDKKNIKQISALVGVSRQSISAFLKTLSEYENEKRLRKEHNSIKRKEYKKEKNREYREVYRMRVTPETMRREHELAVMELSRER